MRTRVKICGITCKQDAQLVVDAGADAMGLVFYSKSPRFIDISKAAEISQIAPAFVSTVALFKDAEQEYVRSVLEQVDIDLIQFHGSETIAFCEQFGRPYIKAVGMRSKEYDQNYLYDTLSRYHSARALLLDGHAPGEAGGSGEVFDWAATGSAVRQSDMAVILAGGLCSDNVGQAIETVKPYAVDVSSGVESSPGVKSAEKVNAFMQQVEKSNRIGSEKS